jgi:hypothetical protein
MGVHVFLLIFSPGKGPIPTGVNGTYVAGGATCTFNVSFLNPSGFAIPNPNPYALVLTFTFPSTVNFGAGLAVYDTSSGTALLLGTLAGSGTFTVNPSGPTALLNINNNGGYTTTWDGTNLRFRAVSFLLVYTTPANTPQAAFTINVFIATHVSGYDLDNDGYVWPTYDCCETVFDDTQVLGYRGCDYPNQVNFGAFEIGGNGVVDSGGTAGASCTALNVNGSLVRGCAASAGGR